MKVSVVLPARNEEGCVRETLLGIAERLERERIPFEIVAVDDNSTDRTGAVLDALAQTHAWCRVLHRRDCPGIGYAIATGLDYASGDAVAIMMADNSDSPDDLVTYVRKAEEGYDCVFGSRWMRGGRVVNYPPHKYVLNRLANHLIRLLFLIRYDDVTNAFKLYRRYVIEGVRPILSCHFNILVELPLKAIVRGYSYAVVPISWTNRKTGVAKLKIREMGSRYFFIILYVLLEKWLSRRDYHRSTPRPRLVLPPDPAGPGQPLPPSEARPRKEEP